MKTIAVVDYGMGNLRSVTKAVERVTDKNCKVVLTDEVKQIAGADSIIVPGQGAARECMNALRQHELVEILLDSVKHKPFLGICMGLQVLMAYSKENDGTDCLGTFQGSVEFFGDQSELQQPGYKIPHMGWNKVNQRQGHPLWQGVPDGARFYFVHSYFVAPAEQSVVMATTQYGLDFACAIGRENIFAVQFHPEKSATDGLRLLNNFVNWDGQG